MAARIALTFAAGLLMLSPTGEAQAPALVLADGGLQFPDGTIQSTAAAKGLAQVEDTNQQCCWDSAGNPIACSGTGQDGELQRGVDWPTPRFTDNGDGTVTDNLTGLIWLKLADCFGLRTWQQALTDAHGLMTGSCGLTDHSMPTDWRLPNIKELLSLVDYSQSAPALPEWHPFASPQTIFYWSSSSLDADPSFAWGVVLQNGIGTTGDKTGSSYAWPVRGGQ